MIDLTLLVLAFVLSWITLKHISNELIVLMAFSMFGIYKIIESTVNLFRRGD